MCKMFNNGMWYGCAKTVIETGSWVLIWNGTLFIPNIDLWSNLSMSILNLKQNS